jgi:RNA polymerase sigma-70 factor, ECF subfamily
LSRIDGEWCLYGVRREKSSVETGAIQADDALFADLYPMLARFAAVVRPPEVEADDLVQEALTRTLAVRPLSDCEDPAAYLRTAIVRLASNHRRSFGRRRRALARMSSTEADSPSYPSDLDDLRRLAPEERAVLYLVFVEGRSYAEAARVLGCKEPAARARSSRALKRLRVELTAEHQEIGDA